MVVAARDALERLRAGNLRFASDRQTSTASTSAERRAQVLAGQEPFAVILGCSDSRVPAEIVFDQGLGDLFVIRVAGNIVAPSQIGSVEFAVERFGTRLVVVLGHSGCGAVMATIEQLEQPRAERSRGLAAIVDRIRPAVEPFMDHPDRMTLAVRANVRAVVEHLRQALEPQRSDGLLVVGAEYALETGVVKYLEES